MEYLLSPIVEYVWLNLIKNFMIWSCCIYTLCNIATSASSCKKLTIIKPSQSYLSDSQQLVATSGKDFKFQYNSSEKAYVNSLGKNVLWNSSQNLLNGFERRAISLEIELNRAFKNHAIITWLASQWNQSC